MPTFQTPVRTERGTYYLDMYWPEMGLVGECDGAVKYTDPQAYVNEKKREQVLRDLGYRIVRWLAAEIMTRPDIVLDRIARALTLSRGLFSAMADIVRLEDHACGLLRVLGGQGRPASRRSPRFGALGQPSLLKRRRTPQPPALASRLRRQAPREGFEVRARDASPEDVEKVVAGAGVDDVSAARPCEEGVDHAEQHPGHDLGILGDQLASRHAVREQLQQWPDELPSRSSPSG
jgi:hypothetical protein